MLETTSLSVDYGGIHALRDVTVKVPDKGVVSIIGANGAGKSTLLKTMAGLVRPNNGAVLLDGQDITKLKPHERMDRGIALCPEGRKLFPDLTVYENIRVGAYRMRDAKKFKQRLEYLEHVFPKVGVVAMLSLLGASLPHVVAGNNGQGDGDRRNRVRDWKGLPP